MNEIKHTPEPWNNSENLVFAKRGFKLYVIDEAECEANARRIAACVNACAGVDTDKLERAGGLAEINVRQRLLAAEMQRDELLAVIAEESALREKMATILSQTAVALKGPEAELSAHSWHDLPEVAASLAKQRDELLTFAEEVRRTGDTRLASMAITTIASAEGSAA